MIASGSNMNIYGDMTLWQYDDVLQAAISSSYAEASDAPATMVEGKLLLAATNTVPPHSKPLPLSHLLSETVFLENIPKFRKAIEKAPFRLDSLQ